MVRRPGNAPDRSKNSGFTGRLASLANYRRMMMNGCGTWSRTTMAKLMRLRRFPTFPRFDFEIGGPPRLCTALSRLQGG